MRLPCSCNLFLFYEKNDGIAVNDNRQFEVLIPASHRMNSVSMLLALFQFGNFDSNVFESNLFVAHAYNPCVKCCVSMRMILTIEYL